MLKLLGDKFQLKKKQIREQLERDDNDMVRAYLSGIINGGRLPWLFGSSAAPNPFSLLLLHRLPKVEHKTSNPPLCSGPPVRYTRPLVRLCPVTRKPSKEQRPGKFELQRVPTVNVSQFLGSGNLFPIEN